MKEEDISIQINVVDNVIPLRIKASELSFMKEVENDINSKFETYRSLYKEADKQQLMAMVCVEIATDVAQLKQMVENQKEFNIASSSKISHLNETIKSFLNSSNS